MNHSRNISDLLSSAARRPWPSHAAALAITAKNVTNSARPPVSRRPRLAR